MNRHPRHFGLLPALCLVLFGFGLEPASPESPVINRPIPFSVATYNVLYLNRDLPALVSTIREADADVVAVQETNPESENFLRNQLKSKYPHIQFRGRGVKGDGFGFLAKAPLRTMEFVETAPGGRGGWMAELSFGTNSVRIVSLHLSTPQTLNGKTLVEMVQRFGQSEAQHEREMSKLLEKFHGETPTIFLGDFNSLPFGRAVQILIARGYCDSFASVTADAERHGTWQPASGHDELRQWPLRLDYILHNDSLRTVRSRILRGAGSDHSLVVSVLDWNHDKVLDRKESPR